MPSLKTMGKLLLHVALIGAIVVAIDGWRTNSHEKDARREAASQATFPDRAAWLSELLPEDVMQEFQSLLDSMGSEDASTPSTEDWIAPIPLAGVSAETSQLESLYQSASSAMNDFITNQHNSPSNPMSDGWSLPFFSNDQETNR